MAAALPSFHMLRELIAKNFTQEPGFVPKRETLFVGLDEDTEPLHDQRTNYLWDGKSKLAFYQARSYSDGSAVRLEEISLQVASAPFVKCKVVLDKHAWNESGQFQCFYSLVTQHGRRDCLNDNFSATFTVSRHPLRGLEPTLVFVGKFSKEHLQGLKEGGSRFTAWLDSM